MLGSIFTFMVVETRESTKSMSRPVKNARARRPTPVTFSSNRWNNQSEEVWQGARMLVVLSSRQNKKETRARKKHCKRKPAPMYVSETPFKSAYKKEK